MESVEEMCDHIVLINHGKNVLYGAVTDIKNEYKQNRYRIETENSLPEDFAEHFQVVETAAAAATVQLEQEAQSDDLLRYLLDRHVRIRYFAEILPTFNEIFIRRVEGTSPEHANGQ